MARRGNPNPERVVGNRGGLTPREKQVLRLAAEGLTNSEIGIVLGVSRETVKSHVKHALLALGCRNRAEMVNVGWKREILPGEPAWVEECLSRLWSRRSERAQRR